MNFNVSEHWMVHERVLDPILQVTFNRASTVNLWIVSKNIHKCLKMLLE